MFNVEGFRNTTFTPRESLLTLEAFEKAGFGDGKIKVRGLTACEIEQANEASQKGKLLSDMVVKLAGSSGKEKAATLLEGVGISGNVPALLAKRHEHVVMGVIEPKLELLDVVRLADTFPIEFSQIANKILELTGLGQQAEVKPKPSGS
mgnify:CR=1 FL=1